MTPEFGPMHQKAKAKVTKTQASQPDDTCTLHNIYTNDRDLFNSMHKRFCIVSWEVQKTFAKQISAMTELGEGIIDAAQFAAATTGFSQQVVRRWAFSYFTALNQYPGSLDDFDLDLIAII